MLVMGKREAEAAYKAIMSGQLSRYRGGEGGYTDRFEGALCRKMKVRHATTVNSGTSALIAALVGLGIGPGDEVIVPAYTWIATAIAPLAVGAVPIIADIDETLTINPKDIERKITRYTKAIIPVHMNDLVCNMNAIMRIAKKHKLHVLEDACQAVGLTYKGRRVGTIGHAGVFSFNHFKNISCGEGGAFMTNDRRVFERALIYHDVGCYTREHAGSVKVPFFPGVNFRVSEIQGAVLCEQLKQIDGILKKFITRRKALAEILKGSDSFRVSPHNDEKNAVHLTLLFPAVKDAALFSKQNKASRPIDSGRHVYTNWEPIIKQNIFHPKMNPYKWAHRTIRYTKNMCAASLDILSRTCHVSFAYNKPLGDLRKRAHKLMQG